MNSQLTNTRPGTFHSFSRRVGRAAFALLCVACFPQPAVAQGLLVNGANHSGSISLAGEIDEWTFTAAQGDRIALSIGEVGLDSAFWPWIRLFGPTGAQLSGVSGRLAAQINITAPSTGTYTVRVASDDAQHAATGEYLLTLAHIPGAFVVPDGDQGGPLTNGGNHAGTIHRADLDQWTFTASAGDAIAVSIGEVGADSDFWPWIRLFGPTGVQLSGVSGRLAAQINVTAPSTGAYTVLVASDDAPHAASGEYLLTLARIPGTFVVPEGDQGGPLTNGATHAGTIHRADLDLWTFTALQGSALTVSIGEVGADSEFWPWIRLFGPTGAQLRSVSGRLAAQINMNAPATGTYTVLVASDDAPHAASGEYHLSVFGAGTTPTFTVTPSAGPNGTISPSTPQVLTSGATVSFTLTPAAGHVIQSVGGTCGGTLIGQVFTTAPVTANCTVIANFAPLTEGPTMTIDKSALYFAAVSNGAAFLAQTSAQIVRLTQSGAGTVTWTAASDQPWLTVTPSAGTGPADLSVAVQATGGVPVGGSVAGSIVLSFSGAGTSPGPVQVVLTTLPVGTSDNPFGVIDTPLDHSTGVSGAVPFTGWGLDDIEVEGVTICRAGVSFEAPPVDPRCGGAGQIYIGDAVFIDGARPDVQATYPTYPRSSRGGWGFMVLTNMLPDVGRGLPTGGNGTFVFYVYGRDREGNVTLLGTRTMTCDNEHATRPFGAIDTPGQGEVVSGSSYVNFGWALTPQPKAIPFDGSTIQVFIDGVAVGTVSYNHFRADIAGFFPGLANSNGAVGFRIIDTTALANGVHTIAWGVTDDTGAAEGIGSRYFTVLNGAAAAVNVGAATRDSELGTRDSGLGARDALPLDHSTILARRGFDVDAPWREYTTSLDGPAIIRGEELDRFELRLGTKNGDSYAGHLRVGDELAPLPVGSHLDAATGLFTWQPGVGFIGTYDLVFVRLRNGEAVARQEVQIVLAPKGSGRVGPQVVIDTPAGRPDAEQPFMLAGWAADPDAATGTGIDTLHVWAYPVSGAAPIFLGVADYGGGRPDVAAVHGEQFRDSGYGLIVQGLVHGTYNLAVFAWSTATGGFVPAKVVRVTVR